MSDLGYFDAVVLGVVQGLTEFLPISSSGHLALAQDWLDLDPAAPHMILFDLLAHVGTVVAVLIVLRASCVRFVRRALREMSGRWAGRRAALRLAGLAVVAVAGTAAVGLGFQDDFERAFSQPAWIACALFLTGGLLAALRWTPRGKTGWSGMRWRHAALIGLAQGAAIFPGISRSGATICMASYCGWRRRWAAEFSFLIAVPAILGATLLKFMQVGGAPISEAAAGHKSGPLLVGAGMSMLVGMIALWLLLRLVRRARLHYFAPYCWLVGALIWLTQA